MLIRPRCEESGRTEQQAAGRQRDRLNRVEDHATRRNVQAGERRQPMLRCCIDLRRNASIAQRHTEHSTVKEKRA